MLSKVQLLALYREKQTYDAFFQVDHPLTISDETKLTVMKSITAFGNPLYDVTIISEKHVPQLLDKYLLKADGQKEISRSEMMSLTQDINGLEQFISPGGCSQNTLRVMQWILRRQSQATMFGSVGNDQEADYLRKSLESEGVRTSYITQKDLPTGKTLALVSGLNRSLVAHIGAAEVLTLQSLLSHPDFSTLVSTSDIIFIEAYFLTNRFEAASHLVELCRKYNKTLVFNLCGEYVFSVVPEPVKHLALSANLIFGNRAEYNALAKLLNCKSTEDLAVNLAKTEGKTVVITDGPRPVKCYSPEEMFEITPPVIDAAQIRDTTAAGDAFIGGFLAGLILSMDLRKCLSMACYAAVNIIKERGCTLPKYDPQIA